MAAARTLRIMPTLMSHCTCPLAPEGPISIHIHDRKRLENVVISKMVGLEKGTPIENTIQSRFSP